MTRNITASKVPEMPRGRSNSVMTRHITKLVDLILFDVFRSFLSFPKHDKSTQFAYTSSCKTPAAWWRWRHRRNMSGSFSRGCLVPHNNACRGQSISFIPTCLIARVWGSPFLHYWFDIFHTKLKQLPDIHHPHFTLPYMVGGTSWVGVMGVKKGCLS